nr:heat shock protein 20 [Monochamus alternatus]
MSLVPFWDDSYLFRPSRLLDQHFGVALGPDDLLQSLINPRMLIQCPAGYLRNWRNAVQDVGSTVSYDKDKFQANIDVQQFKPDEITVKITGDRTVTVEGKHEEKQDEHGYISRHFIRKYVLPPNCDVNQVQSNLSSDGVLTIVAPKAIEGKKTEERAIPVTQTGQPAKLEEKKES